MYNLDSGNFALLSCRVLLILMVALNYFKKWPKDSNRHFSNWDVQVEKQHIKILFKNKRNKWNVIVLRSFMLSQVSQPQHYWHFRRGNSYEDCPVYCRMFSSNPWHLPISTPQTHTTNLNNEHLQISPNVPWGAELPVKNHCAKWWKPDSKGCKFYGSFVTLEKAKL